MAQSKRVYRDIEFAEGIKLSEKEFIKLYERQPTFLKIPEGKERDKELKKAHKIAVKGNI